ncbi:MAG: acyl-CoA dehydrogenase family protein [Polyangiales bacterium]
MAFFQQAPALEDPFSTDRVLRSYLARTFGTSAAREHLESQLKSLSAVVLEELHPLQVSDRLNEPVLTPWDPWGNRIDHIEVTPLWKRAREVAAQYGLVATGYEKDFGALNRVAQFALVYLFAPSSDVYTCPLAMTDGAARTLLAHGNQTLIERALPRLASRDPKHMWTSGQWMTEKTGGSDVGLSETVARKGDDGQWLLSGTKWFTSATTSEMTLTLARPEGNPRGGKGLALFYLELRDERGRLKNISINRLKDKLGTRKVPTAELELVNTPAVPVVGTSDGVRAITPMLNSTRTWNAVNAVAFMRRGISLSRDYARKRFAFGANLADKPLHAETLADMQCEFEAAFHLTFRVCELLGADDHRALDAQGEHLLRVITPLAKLLTGKQAVSVASETLECFGGAGYVEDTGLPMILRDSQVLPIWEGTTNVLSLDTLKALAKSEAGDALVAELSRCAALAGDGDEGALARAALGTVKKALGAIAERSSDLRALEASARMLSLTLARSLALALLSAHAAWSKKHEGDGRATLAAQRFLRRGIDCMSEATVDSARSLAMDEP